MSWQPPALRESLKWIAVDFDGTIADSDWSVSPYPTGVLPGVEQKLFELVRNGYSVVVHTARPWSDYEMIESFMLEHGLPFRRIVCGKLLADRYVDDRNIDHRAESWLP